MATDTPSGKAITSFFYILVIFEPALRSMKSKNEKTKGATYGTTVKTACHTSLLSASEMRPIRGKQGWYVPQKNRMSHFAVEGVIEGVIDRVHVDLSIAHGCTEHQPSDTAEVIDTHLALCHAANN